MGINAVKCLIFFVTLRVKNVGAIRICHSDLLLKLKLFKVSNFTLIQMRGTLFVHTAVDFRLFHLEVVFYTMIL